MVRQLIYSLILFPVFICTAAGQPTPDRIQAEQLLAQGTQRIVVIGDIHGDYQQFTKLLGAAGLVDKRHKWIGGDAHLVQLGDIPDRGPDSRKVMDLLMGLEKSSRKTGGAVTVLIGNHEAMMMTNDLRYVHPGVYKSFKDKDSKARRNAYYQQTIDHLTKLTPQEQLPKFDKAYRKAWEQRIPLGYVEHRIAWAPTGTYGKWVISHAAVARVGDSLFVHGGISPEYAGMSIAEINTRVRTDLADAGNLSETTILEDELGPLWHRGWAGAPQTIENEAALDGVLAAFEVKRMVVAHTPILPIVLPRFGGKLLIVDVGLSEHYGHGFSALVIKGQELSVIIADQQLPLPTNADDVDPYLEAAALLVADPGRIQRYRLATQKALQSANANAEVEFEIDSANEAKRAQK